MNRHGDERGLRSHVRLVILSLVIFDLLDRIIPGGFGSIAELDGQARDTEVILKSVAHPPRDLGIGAVGVVHVFFESGDVRRVKFSEVEILVPHELTFGSVHVAVYAPEIDWIVQDVNQFLPEVAARALRV